jgi:hypothetical protein
MAGQIKIEWITDSVDCEQCGGNWADGARVHKDGDFWFELTPHAHCYDGDSYSERDVYAEMLKRLGFVIEDEYA